MILRLLLLTAGVWCYVSRKNVLRDLIMDEEMKVCDPLEWLPDWMGNKEAQQAVLQQMKESPEYRLHFYSNVEGLSFGEILVILQNFKLEDQRVFLTNEVIAKLRPTVFTAFKPEDLPNYPIISFRFAAISQILSQIHPDTLVALIERHLAKYSFFDRRLAPWILQVDPKHHLNTKNWSSSLTAWETFTSDTLLLASRTDINLVSSIMEIFLVLPSEDTLSLLRVGIRRVVRLKLFLYSFSADFDESSRIIIQNKFMDLLYSLLALYSKLGWAEREEFVAIRTWLAHLHDQLNGGWWSSPTPHPPPGHLIESLLHLESVQHPKIRFERRWQWPILQLMMPQSGRIPNLPTFVAGLVVDADAEIVVWDEIAGLCGEIQKFGYLGVWRRMFEAFEKAKNRDVCKKMSGMEKVICIDNFEQPTSPSESPSKDCIIQ